MAEQAKIIAPDAFFLYLPLIYADAEDYFGLIPEKYHLELLESPGSGLKSDEDIFRRLMDNKTHSNEQFAVGDPTTMLRKPYGTDKEPLLLASLITNAAFWAVNHGKTETKKISELSKYDKIISFGRGTTSNIVARRIKRETRKSGNIDIETHDNIHDFFKKLDQIENSVALSPQINDIISLINNKEEYDIELSIGKTSQFRNVLVTGLMSRKDIVKEKPDLVKPLLRALQRALIEVRSFIEYGEEYLEPDDRVSEDTLKDVRRRLNVRSKEEMSQGLVRAEKDQVYPATIEPKKKDWKAAVKASCMSDPPNFIRQLPVEEKKEYSKSSSFREKEGNNKKCIEEEGEKELKEFSKQIAEKQYKKRIKPYKKLYREAIIDGLSSKKNNSSSTPNVDTVVMAAILVSIGILIGLITTVTLDWLSTLGVFSIMTLGVITDWYVGYKSVRWARITFWILVVSLLMVLVFETWIKVAVSIIIPIIFTLSFEVISKR